MVIIIIGCILGMRMINNVQHYRLSKFRIHVDGYAVTGCYTKGQATPSEEHSAYLDWIQ